MVVDDGPTDETCQVVQRNIFSNISDISDANSMNKNVNISCLSLEQSQGKGSAISHGIQEVMRLQSPKTVKIVQEQQQQEEIDPSTNVQNHSSY